MKTQSRTCYILYHSKIIFTTVRIQKFNWNILVYFDHTEKKNGIIAT